jgi:ribosome-associated translation inhibitor RaiA
VRVVANLAIHDAVFHAEAVKPSPESAADRVRNSLEAEIRKFRGREKSYLRQGRAAVKKFFGR